MKVIFMGTPDFGVEALENLIEHHEVIMVVTQPDRKVGRKRVLTPTPIKVVAEKHGITVFQPEKIKEDYQPIIDASPQLIVTAAYGQFVPVEVLETPKYGAINIHASLLPKYRGGSPIHAAIRNGDMFTGVSIMYMVKKMDAGDILSQERVMIEDNDTALSMFDKLGTVGANLVIETIDKLVQGDLKTRKQNDHFVSYAPNIKREDEKIDWKTTTFRVDCHIRGYHTWPGTYSEIHGEKVKIFPGKMTSIKGSPGEVIDITNEGILVATTDGSYLITDLQVQGKKKMTVSQFINGNKLINKGDYFSL